MSKTILSFSLDTAIQNTPDLVKRDVLRMALREAELEFQLEMMRQEMVMLRTEITRCLIENGALKAVVKELKG
jgi:hypothetical protein